MEQIAIIETGAGKVLTKTPFHPDFPKRAKRLGGRWDAAEKAWLFDARDAEKVRELCREIYGSDGTPLPRGALLTVRTDPAKCDRRDRSLSFWLCGRLVAKATGRDSGARLGDGVVIVKGGFSSGGSVKNPECAFKPGTVFELRDVPREIAERMHGEYHGVTLLDADGRVVAEPTIEPPPAADPIADLEREIADDERSLHELSARLEAKRSRLAAMRAGDCGY